MSNNKQPLVSVVMPAYNAEKYIFPAIKSVLDQTYRNLELVIVNDGSTDTTDKIVRKIKDERIRYFRLEKNMGRGYARNFSIAQCKGKYIAVCDADDINIPQRIALQVDFLEKHEAIDILSGQLLHFSDLRKPARIYHFPELPEVIKSYYDGGVMGVAHAACMLRSKCFETFKYEDEIAYNVEDFELFLRLNKRYKMASLPDTLVLYRNDLSAVSLNKIKYHKIYHEYSIYLANAKLNGIPYKRFEEWSAHIENSMQYNIYSIMAFTKLKIKQLFRHTQKQIKL